jgi:hypothetical protein
MQKAPTRRPDLIREKVKLLVDLGYVRWTDENSGIDDYPADKPLPIEVTASRIVRLSEGSTLGCPTHDIELVPDACGSCKFLAGES